MRVLGRAKQLDVVDLGVALRIYRLSNLPGELGELFDIPDIELLSVLFNEKEPVPTPSDVAFHGANSVNMDQDILGFSITCYIRDGNVSIFMQGGLDCPDWRFNRVRSVSDFPQVG